MFPLCELTEQDIRGVQTTSPRSAPAVHTAATNESWRATVGGHCLYLADNIAGVMFMGGSKRSYLELESHMTSDGPPPP